MAKELITLDPAEVAVDRSELALHTATAAAGPITVRQEGPDWGDAQIAAYMAEGERGEVPVDFRVPNRTVTIPLMLHGNAFAEARRQVQQKVGLFQREGGWLKRTMSDGSALYLDVVNATLKMGGHGFQAQHDIDDKVDLVLETLPDFYGDEITLDAVTEGTELEIVTVLKDGGVDAVIQGDYPGRCRIEVSNETAGDQLGLLWAFRARHFDAATTAAVRYEAEALDPLDSATIMSDSTASGGASNNIVRHQNLGTGWTPVLGTNIGGTTPLTHVGSYRVWARLKSPDEDVTARFVYDVGDLTLPEENDPWVIPGVDQFYLADLGELRLDQLPYGSHRWQGQLQAKGATGGEDIIVDKLWFQPVDEGVGKVRATPPVAALGDVLARDEFKQSAGALTGKTAAVGGVWAGAGDADSFTVDAATATARRSATVDTTVNTGRYATLGGLSQLDVDVRVDFQWSALDGQYAGVLARYTGTTHAIRCEVVGSSDCLVRLRFNYPPTDSWRTAESRDVGPLAINAWYTLRLVVIDLRYWVWLVPRGGAFGTPVLAGSASSLIQMTGGTVGIYDAYTGSQSITRQFDNFKATPPARDAAIYAHRSAQLATEGMFRDDQTGTAPGLISHVVGDLPRIPPSGMEGRPVELFVKASRGDLDQMPDTGMDEVAAQVFYRPSWLFAPDAAT